MAGGDADTYDTEIVMRCRRGELTRSTQRYPWLRYH